MTVGPVEEVEDRARRRFARWNPGAWQALVDGPARGLAGALSREPAATANALLRSYLELAAEGVGQGLLSTKPPFPNVLSLLWVHVVPRQLATLPAPDRAAALAEAWNLGEALEAQPGWLRALFLRLCSTVELASLRSVVDDVQRRALDPPAGRLGTDLKPTWIHLAAEDPRFLPGALHFVSPTVCCVHDRSRKAAAGRPAACVGVWLDEPPVLLGATACAESPAASTKLKQASLLEAAVAADPRVTDVHAAAANGFRGAVALETSQFLVGLLPG
jgi:hypothetical protein